MAYSIEFTRQARKDFSALPSVVKPRVAEAIKGLADQPRPHGCRKLVEVDGWRIRVGDYRILYTMDDSAQVVTVYWIGVRGNAYRK